MDKVELRVNFFVNGKLPPISVSMAAVATLMAAAKFINPASAQAQGGFMQLEAIGAPQAFIPAVWLSENVPTVLWSAVAEDADTDIEEADAEEMEDAGEDGDEEDIEDDGEDAQ